MGSQITQAEISVGRAGIARPVALPMGELARLKAVTERVPCSNLRTPCKLLLPAPSQARRWLASSPKGGAKGGCAAGFFANV